MHKMFKRAELNLYWFPFMNCGIQIEKRGQMKFIRRVWVIGSEWQLPRLNSLRDHQEKRYSVILCC